MSDHVANLHRRDSCVGCVAVRRSEVRQTGMHRLHVRETTADQNGKAANIKSLVIPCNVGH